MSEHRFTALFPFCGLGAGARGFLEAVGQLGRAGARFENLGGIDLDGEACEDFRRLTGGPALQADISKMTPAELLAFAGARRPDVVFSSPPCQGLSGLLSAKMAETFKYQQLNRLVLQGIFLVLETWDEKPGLIVIENVPRITTRGKDLLAQVRQLLSGYGYLFHEATHDCGELGGLAQHRKRWLLVARRPEAVPGYVYQVPKKRVRGCGEVLGELPLPGDPAAGPLHQLPRISWLNWLRLALIPAGGDWRDLPENAPKSEEARRAWEQEGVKTPGEKHLFKGKHGVMPWDEPSRAVIGGPSNGAANVADPRVMVGLEHDPRRGALGVQGWDEPAATVRGRADVRTGPAAVADPRIALGSENPDRHENKYRVTPWGEPAHAVIGATRPGSGSPNVADPRVASAVALGRTAEGADTFKGRPGLFGVAEWSEPAPTVTGSARVGTGNGLSAVADPRLGLDHEPRAGVLGVIGWENPSPTVTGNMRPTGSNTPASVADPRAFSELQSPLEPGQEKRAVWARYDVRGWTQPARTVAGSGSNGGFGVADVRVDEVPLGCQPRAGSYGVLSWEQAVGTVTGNARVDNGAFAVADPRRAPDWIPVIIAADGTWHRPLTMLELAALQGLPAVLNGEPLKLAGRSVSGHRRRIGNAVPVQAARAIAESLLRALLASVLGDWSIILSPDGSPVWVRKDGLLEDGVDGEAA